MDNIININNILMDTIEYEEIVIENNTFSLSNIISNIFDTILYSQNNMQMNNIINYTLNRTNTQIQHPLTLSTTILKEYLSNNFDNCIRIIEELDKNILESEIYNIFLYLFIKISNNKDIIYNKKFIKHLLNKFNNDFVNKFIYDPIFKRNLVKYMFDNDMLFKDILYCRKNWCQYYKFNDSWDNFLHILILYGNERQLLWFLDWETYNNNIDWYKKEDNDYFKICLLAQKFKEINILLRYGFKLKFSQYYFFTTAGLLRYNMKIYENYYIFKYDSLYDKVSINEFTEKFNDLFNGTFKCDSLLGMYLMDIDTDEEENNILNNYGDKESCIAWNVSLLYELPYPKKIILMACKNICLRTNHFDCCKLHIIKRECKNIIKKYKLNLCIQYYLINREKKIKRKNDLYYHKIIYKKLYLKSLIKKNENDCLICMEKIDINDNTLLLNCHHIYHNECFKIWYKQSKECVYCKKNVFI